MVNRRWWDVAALAVAAVLVTLTLLDPPVGPDDVGVWAATGAFLIVYVAYARWHLDDPPMGHHIAISLLFAAILAVGTSFEPSFAILQAFVYPFVWTTAPTLRSALAANFAIAAALVAGYAAHYGPAGIVSGFSVALLSCGFSIALGLWITRIAAYGQERARLLDELQAAQGQLAAMHRDAGIADERGRLAREIHDTIAQSLTGLVMVAQRADNRLASVAGDAAASARGDVQLIEEMARDALTEARGLVASLAPVDAEAGLPDALRRLAAGFERETGVAVAVSADAAAPGRELEVVLLRCAQEGLANVRKHARATHAEVRVESDPSQVVLTVRDDGVGPGDAVPGEGGFGLAGMRDRVALVGGEFSFGAGASGGTELRVAVPLADAAPDATAATSTAPATTAAPPSEEARA
jgi:signal transduction histidine kinase